VRKEYHVRECAACKHRFAECCLPADYVSRTYSDSYFFGSGAGYPDYFEEENILKEHGHRYAQILSRYVPRAARNMLDVGGACGFIADGFRAAGWRPQLLEPNARMATWGREHFDLTTHNCTLENFEVPHEFDVVCMIQVAAHFPNPLAAFRKAADLTCDGGWWLVETWNCQSMTARTFGRYWHEYNPPSVLQYFSSTSLRGLAGQFGFEHVASGRPRKNIMWRHARTLLNYQMPWAAVHRLTGLIPDETVLPYPAGDLQWSLFRKSNNCNCLARTIGC
jgi:hypothetical protein